MEANWMLADALLMRRDLLAETGATYRVFVRGLIVPCSIGIYEHERLEPQRVRASVLITVDRNPGAHIGAVLNYESIVEAIRAVAESGHIELVETFAGRLIEHCFEDRRVLSAWVSVEKLDPYPEAEGVGVIMERHRRGVASGA